MPRRIGWYKPPGSGNPARAYDRLPDRREDKRFYDSRAWGSMRRLVLDEQPLCGLCATRGRLAPSEHVHHIKPRKEFPELALDRANLVGLCQACHNEVRHLPPGGVVFATAFGAPDGYQSRA